MVTLRYLVTGTGRCGTVGLAAALTCAGIPCSHERFFNGNTLEEALLRMETNSGENSLCSQHCGLSGLRDPVVAESSYMAAPYLGASCFAATTVIHVVRNPWKVILSFLNNIQFFRGEPEHEHERFIYSVLPQLHEIGNPIDRAVYYYIRWNRLVEMLARKRRRGRYIFHPIEDGSEPLLRKLGVREDLIRQCQKKDVNSFKEWPEKLRNLAPARQMRVEQINASNYAAELRMLAKRYGYEISFPTETLAEPVSEEAAPSADSEARFARVPRILEAGYRGYNLVRWRTDCYALHQQSLEGFALETAGAHTLKESMARGIALVAPSLREVREKVDQVVHKYPGLEKGKPFWEISGYAE